MRTPGEAAMQRAEENVSGRGNNKCKKPQRGNGLRNKKATEARGKEGTRQV